MNRYINCDKFEMRNLQILKSQNLSAVRIFKSFDKREMRY
jgi:hypothetical protein